MRFNLRFALFLLLMVLAARLPVPALAQQGSPLITGVVTDRNTGQPIANARVFFYGTAYGTVFTDATGRYTFTGSDLTSFGGAISGNLYVGATGYFEAPPVFVSDLSSQPSLPVVQDITLRPGGAVIRGVVRDASTGLGISAATVSFTRNPMSTFLGGGVTEAVQTLTDGSYAIDSSYFNESGLSGGFSANLQVNAQGYLGATRSVSFTSYPVTEDFSLISLNRPPVANAGPDKTGIVGESLQFDGTASSDPDGSISSFRWNFGDGASATGAIVRHIYTSAGTFTVTLTVTDNVGATGEDTAVVNVQTFPQALQSLSDLVTSFNLAEGISNSLDAKLQAVSEALQAANAGQRQDAVNKLLAFINEVEAQRGKELTNSQADTLIGLASRILAVL